MRRLLWWITLPLRAGMAVLMWPLLVVIGYLFVPLAEDNMAMANGMVKDLLKGNGK